MARPPHLYAIDTMIGFVHPEPVERELAQVKERLRGPKHTAGYMFRDVPPDGGSDVVDATIAAMDRNRVGVGLVSTARVETQRAVLEYPTRFVLETHVDGHDIMSDIQKVRAEHDTLGTRAVSIFPAGTVAQHGVADARWYPLYATCVELEIPVLVNAGVPGPRVPMATQHVEGFDQVCYDFPDLTVVMRHGAEPWAELAVKLMLKWPGLHYSTSAFAPRYYPTAIIDYLNTRGHAKVLYGDYFPMALSLDRIFQEIDNLAVREDRWEAFLRGNAARLLRIGDAA